VCLKWRIHVIPQLYNRDVGLKEGGSIRLAPGVLV